MKSLGTQLSQIILSLKKKVEHKIVDLKNYLLLGVPVAFHEGANGCKIKVIIHHLLNTEDDLEEIILDDCVATTVDDDVSGDN